MRDRFIARLTEHARTNKKIFLITGDLGFGVLTDYATELPDQYLNVGVAEQNMTGVAAGLALEGRIVFTYSIANFPILRCLEQVRNAAAYHRANVKVVAIGGGFSYGVLGMSHHATEDLAVLRSLPDVTVVAPGCLWEAEEATSALIEWPGTCYLRLDKSYAEPTAKPGEKFEIGVARRVISGGDVTIVTAGGILGDVISAATVLAEKNGISCDVISAHTLSPFDSETVLASIAETGRVVTVEEHVIEGGLGSAVAEACFDACLQPTAAVRLGVRGSFSSVAGSQDYLRAKNGIDKQSIVEAIISIKD